MKMILKCYIVWLGLFIQLVATEVGDICSLENGQGVCLEIIECEVALSAVLLTGFTSLPRCGFQNTTEIVCCPETNASTKNRVADRECEKIVDQFIAPTVTKVIGGKHAAEGEFPHMVALAFPLQESSYHFRCGGSLISDRHILTAAHCVRNLDSKIPVFARVGVLDISDTRFTEGMDYMIDTVISHPEYTRPEQYNDIAIIRLSKPVVTSEVVFPVCLYTKNRDPAIPLAITGWGVNDVQTSSTSNLLLKGELTIVSLDICNKSYKKSRRLPQGITSGQICAQDTDRAVDACQGDSGGPLQGLTSDDGYYRLVGVTSLGTGCATSVPGVYTRVNKYIDWIESVVWPSN